MSLSEELAIQGFTINISEQIVYLYLLVNERSSDDVLIWLPIVFN